MIDEAHCPNGGVLIDTSDQERETFQVMRQCTCGFSSVGPRAASSYADHLLGLV